MIFLSLGSKYLQPLFNSLTIMWSETTEKKEFLHLFSRSKCVNKKTREPEKKSAFFIDVSNIYISAPIHFCDIETRFTSILRNYR